MFSQKANSLVPHHFRVVVDGDMITTPAHTFGRYQHCGSQVLVDSDCLGNVIVAPTIVEAVFRTRSKASLYCHRLGTYRDCLEACFEGSEADEYNKSRRRPATRTKASLANFSNGAGRDEDLPPWLGVNAGTSSILV